MEFSNGASIYNYVTVIFAFHKYAGKNKNTFFANVVTSVILSAPGILFCYDESMYFLLLYRIFNPQLV